MITNMIVDDTTPYLLSSWNGGKDVQHTTKKSVIVCPQRGQTLSSASAHCVQRHTSPQRSNVSAARCAQTTQRDGRRRAKHGVEENVSDDLSCGRGNWGTEREECEIVSWTSSTIFFSCSGSSSQRIPSMSIFVSQQTLSLNKTT